jgi:type VI protein secretion system component Hcp
MVMSFGCAAVLVVVQSFTSLSQAEAVLTSVTYFLQITDPVILGESTVVGHVGEIDLLSFTMSFSQPVTPATCGILRLLKNVDRASPNLVISAILNRHHGNAVLSGVTNDGIVNFRMSLTNVIVLSVNISDSSGVPPATEEVTLQVQRIVLDVRPEDPRSGGAPTATIDCAAKKGA